MDRSLLIEHTHLRLLFGRLSCVLAVPDEDTNRFDSALSLFFADTELALNQPRIVPLLSNKLQKSFVVFAFPRGLGQRASALVKHLSILVEKLRFGHQERPPNVMKHVHVFVELEGFIRLHSEAILVRVKRTYRPLNHLMGDHSDSLDEPFNVLDYLLFKVLLIEVFQQKIRRRIGLTAG